MANPRFFLMQLSAPARAAVNATVLEAFPEAEVVEVGTMEEAERTAAAAGPELLVLDASASAQVIEGTRIAGRDGLPRWPVIVLGRGASDLAETVPPDDWNPRHLAYVFRAALQQHELLCENLRLRGDMKTVARRFSHDVYTPIGCILTSASVLKVLPSDPGQSREVIVQGIAESATEIFQLVERLSFVLRASADSFAPSEVEMGEVFAAVRNQLEADILKVGATVSTPSSWPKVSGVPQWLKVIWWNLLGNALKHGGPAGQIRIAWSAEDDGQRFSVIDSGAGVKPEMQAELFRPFDQLHRQQRPGLGLAIVHRLTALQGGRCGYYRTLEGGTCFHFTLPPARS